MYIYRSICISWSKLDNRLDPTYMHNRYVQLDKTPLFGLRRTKETQSYKATMARHLFLLYLKFGRTDNTHHGTSTSTSTSTSSLVALTSCSVAEASDDDDAPSPCGDDGIGDGDGSIAALVSCFPDTGGGGGTPSTPLGSTADNEGGGEPPMPANSMLGGDGGRGGAPPRHRAIIAGW